MLFINAVNEVTRERAQSFLADRHIRRIIAAYQAFADEDGFARAVSNEEIRAQGGNLSIPLYIRTGNSGGNSSESAENGGLERAIADWQASSAGLRRSMDQLLKKLQKD